MSSEKLKYSGFERRESEQALTKHDIEPIFTRLKKLELQVESCSNNVNIRIEESKKGYENIKASIEELEIEVKKAVKNGDIRLKSGDIQLKIHDESIAKLENAVSSISMQLDLMASTAADQRSTLASIHAHVSSTATNQSAVLESINVINRRFESIASQKSTQKQKLTVFQSVPAVAWPVFGVVALALIAAATGQMAAFIGWLGTIKFFGGV